MWLTFLLLTVSVTSVVVLPCPEECTCSTDNDNDKVFFNCSHANLTNIPHGDFYYDDDIYLDLSWNRLKIIGNHTFKDRRMYSIVRIDLSHNEFLGYIEPNAFKTVGYTEHLDFSFNDIAYISPLVFNDLKEDLKYLSFSHNRYLELPEKGFRLTNLEELHLDNCGLENIPQHFFQKMKKLKYIHLQNNRISNIDTPLFKNLLSLEKLDISNNKLQNIQVGVLWIPMSVLQMDLSGNPWRCDCDMKKLILSYPENKFVQNLTCDRPKIYLNIVFTLELASSLSCDTTTSTTTITTTTTTTTTAPSKVDVSTEKLNATEGNDIIINRNEEHESTRKDFREGQLPGGNVSEAHWSVHNLWWIACAVFMMVMIAICVLVIMIIKFVCLHQHSYKYKSVSVDNSLGSNCSTTVGLCRSSYDPTSIA